MSGSSDGQQHTGVRTLADDDRTSFLRGEARFRVVGAVALLLVVVAAAIGLLGPGERTVTADVAAGRVEMVHPHLTRPGLDAAFTVTVEPTQPTEVVRLRIDSDALSRLGLEVVHPTPVSEKAGDGVVVYEVSAADSGAHEITVSGRVPTKAPPGRLSWDVVWLPDGAEPVTLGVTTWVLP